MHLSVVDPILVIAFILAAYDGRRRGFAIYASELLAFAVSVSVALYAFHPIASFLSTLGAPLGITGFGIFAAIVVVGHHLVMTAINRFRPDTERAVSQPFQPSLPQVRPAGAGNAARPMIRVAATQIRQPYADQKPAPWGIFPAVAAAAALSALVLNAILVLPGQRSLQTEVRRSTVGSAIVATTDFLQHPLSDLLTPGHR